MVREALTNYLALASGLTEVTRQRARSAAKALVAQGEATVEQVSGLAQEVIETSRANRNALVNLVRYEIDRALGQVGLATAEDLSGLQRRVAELEKAIRELTAAVVEYEKAAGPAPLTEPPPATAKPAKAATAAKAAKAAKTTAGKGAAGKGGAKTAGGKNGSTTGPTGTLQPPKKAAAKAGRKSAGAARPAGAS